MFQLPGKVPVSITPFFFLTAGLIGWINSQSLFGTLIWIGIIFVSILIHECGHAYSMKLFGQRSRIELVAFGGLTVPDGPRLSKGKEFLVVFAGPFFGFCLFLLSAFLYRSQIFSNPLLNGILWTTAAINLFWTAVNLLPVLPLDGGQLVRILLESIFGTKGMRYALLSSIAIAGGVGIIFLIGGVFLISVLFFIFAFQNFETYRRMKVIAPADGNEKYQNELASIEELLVEGRLDEALPILEQLREKTKQGLLYNLCTQYVAQIYYKQKNFTKVHELLAPIYKDIAPLELVMLQEAAHAVNDYDLVLNISPECFQVIQSPEIALRAARAAAAHKDIRATVGWLSSAAAGGVANIDEFMKDPVFEDVKNTKEVQELLEKIHKKKAP